MKLLNWETTPVNWREELSEGDLTILELEENFRRKEMTWQEEALTVYKVHCLKTDQAAKAGEEWTRKMTGAMMGLGKMNVNYMVMVAKELKVEPKTGIHQCDSFWAAIRFCMQKREDEAQKVIAQAVMPAPAPKPPPAAPGETPAEPPTGLILLEPTPATPTGIHTVPLSEMFFRMDCLEWMAARDNASVHHIITDPPYAIDMEMLNQNNPHGSMVDIDRVAETHKVDDNLELLKRFVPEAYRVTDDRGFLVMFCDPMRWQYLYDLCIAAGWRVQRWPFIWHKTHQCMNQAAQANMTKNFEFAMVCRKPKAVLKKVCGTSVFTCSGQGYLSNPFAKPFDLWAHLIEAVSLIGETVLDPFMGEGSSTRTAVSCHRKPIGVEIDEKHFNVAVDEIRKLYDVVLRKPIYT